MRVNVSCHAPLCCVCSYTPTYDSVCPASATTTILLLYCDNNMLLAAVHPRIPMTHGTRMTGGTYVALGLSCRRLSRTKTRSPNPRKKPHPFTGSLGHGFQEKGRYQLPCTRTKKSAQLLPSQLSTEFGPIFLSRCRRLPIVMLHCYSSAGQPNVHSGDGPFSRSFEDM